MKSALALLAACLALSTPVLAATSAATPPAADIATPAAAAPLSAAYALLETMHMDKVLNEAIEQSLEMQLQQNPEIRPFRDIMLSFLGKHMSFANLRDDLARLYANEFNEKELRDITAFYGTETGQKVLAKMPVLMNKGAELGAAKVEANTAELEALISARIDEMKAREKSSAGKSLAR